MLQQLTRGTYYCNPPLGILFIHIIQTPGGGNPFGPVNRGGGAAGTNVFAQANFNANQFQVDGTVASIKNGALTTNLSLTTPAFSGLASGTITFAPGGIDLDTLDSILLRTDSSGFPAEANIGTGLSWDGSTLSATASGSQTPWLSDINGAATNRLTNVLSVSAGVYYLNQQRTSWISNDTLGNTYFCSSNQFAPGYGSMVLNQFGNSLVIPQTIWNTNETLDVRAYFNKVVAGTNYYFDVIGLPLIVVSDGRDAFIISNGVGRAMFASDVWIETNLTVKGNGTFGTGSGGTVTANSFESPTNTWQGSAFWLGTNAVIVSTTNILLSSLAGMPTTTERYGKLIIIASGGSITVTNPISWGLIAGGTNKVVSQTVEAGARLVISGEVLNGICTNFASVKLTP